MKLASRLSAIELEDSATGDPVALGKFWQDHTTVLIFLRHFG